MFVCVIYIDGSKDMRQKPSLSYKPHSGEPNLIVNNKNI